MIQLYGYWRSTAAYRVRIALNWKGLDYENLSVHLVKDGGEQHKPEYRKLNPQGLVPLLVDGDFKLNQSLAILEYLEEKYPGPAMLPGSPELKAQNRALSHQIAMDIHPLNNLRVLQFLAGPMNVGDESKLEWYKHWIEVGFKSLEKQLDKISSGPFCIGSEPTMADMCLIPQVYNAQRFECPLDEFPRIRAINENCLKLEAFEKAQPHLQPDAV